MGIGRRSRLLQPAEDSNIKFIPLCSRLCPWPLHSEKKKLLCWVWCILHRGDIWTMLRMVAGAFRLNWGHCKLFTPVPTSVYNNVLYMSSTRNAILPYRLEPARYYVAAGYAWQIATAASLSSHRWSQAKFVLTEAYKMHPHGNYVCTWRQRMYNFGHITSNASTDRDAQSVLNLQQVQNAYAKLIFNFLGEDSHFTYYFLKNDENTVGLRAHGADKSTTQKIQNAPW